MSDVRSTHWADNDRKKYAALGNALPNVLETVFEDWQDRVDNRGADTPYSPHLDVTTIVAMRYETVPHPEYGKLRQPTGEERTYLVATDGVASFRIACDTVAAYLKDQGKGTDWGFRTGANATIMVLDGTRKGV